MDEIDPAIINLKKELESRHIRGLALDIDDLLAATNAAYFQTLFDTFGNPEKLSVEDALKKYVITHSVPYWQTEEIKKFLKEIRRDKAIQSSILPMEGARTAINELSNHVPFVCYVTARPEEVRAVTEEWLKKNGFPFLPVLMRPDSVDDEHITTWKGPVLEYLYPSVMGIIDDNPSFTKTVSENYKGILFLYHPDPTLTTHIRTISCPTWESVVTAVKTYAPET